MEPRGPRLKPAKVIPNTEEWFNDKEFTTDWLSPKLGPWFSVLEPLRNKPVDVLDVGSYEGRSAIAFLSYLPLSRVTCVDTFDLPGIGTHIDDTNAVESRFDRNVAAYGQRLTKIKDRAANALDRLGVKKAKYDVIYLDAGKGRDWLFTLSALAWPLLRTGGILIWDDLRWGRDKPGHLRPGEGIRLFCATFSDCLDILHEDRQMIARKTADWPDAGDRK